MALGADATRSPLAQPPCFVHEACAASGWNVSSGHASHFSAFVVAETVPAAHGWQLRSAVAFGSETTCSPLAHTVCGRQKPLPAAGWNVLFGHASHTAAFVVLEKEPGGQAWQRAGDGSLALASNVPGRHGSRTAGTAKPAPQYVPSGHAIGSFVPLGQKKPAGQRPEHVLSVWLRTLPKCLASHDLQLGFPASSWNEPAEHADL